ncbi:MAG: ECF-type sigma factor [Planctomycetaceae bacterium]
MSSQEPEDNPECVSILLQRVRHGDDTAREALFSVVYDQLRRMAQGLMQSERNDHTLQASALINEAYLKLIKGDVIQTVENRRHLFGTAARAMQQVLIDHARARATAKRGANFKREHLDNILDEFEDKHQVPFLDLEAALTRLRDESPRQYEVISLRFFAGLSIPEAAQVLDCSEGTVQTEWRMARARLHTWLKA